MEIHPTEMNQGENDYEKDLQRLTSTIAGKIGEGVQKIESFFSSACIYRVSEDLRKLKESAYTPRLIAIGPLHREDKHLQTPLQHIKMSYTNNLLSRLTARMEDPALAEQTKFTVLQKCLAEMKTLVDDAKKCYAEEVTLDEEMMLVDGCFILEFLYMYRSRRQLYGDSMATQRKLDGDSKGQKTDPIFGNSLTLVFVRSDLVLLENQIPFFVLEKLFQLTLGRIPDSSDEKWSLSDYVWSCYGVMMSPVGKSTNAIPPCSPSDCVLSVFGNKSTTNEEEDRKAKYYHILHNLHYGCLPRDQTKQKEEPSEKVVLMPSASELAYAGVMFVPDESGNDLFKFKFREPKGLFWWCLRACFVMPPLDIYDSTEIVLRNLIALEQSCPAVLQRISSYACVMDMLVNSDKDVQVLEKAGVMRNHLGAVEDATDLFNNLCKEIYFGDYFAETCIKATQYSKCFWPKNMAHLRRTYFASPWTFIAFCVGFIAFIMSFLQFVRDFHKKNG